MVVEERTWVGKSVARREDASILAGRGVYIDDIKLPGMLHAAVLRSPHAHARINSIDTSAAKQVPGVVAVLTGPEALEFVTPMPAFCAEPVVQHAIATDRVRFVGEAVAAVAATSRYAAEDACQQISVEYEPLPALSTPAKRCDPMRRSCMRRCKATWCSSAHCASATSRELFPAPRISSSARCVGTVWVPSRSRPRAPSPASIRTPQR
jgi:xanthine dehydrogenase molybdopterin-binding subunit B